MDKMAAQLVSGGSEMKLVASLEMCNCRLHWTAVYSNTLFGFRRTLGRDYGAAATAISRSRCTVLSLC